MRQVLFSLLLCFLILIHVTPARDSNAAAETIKKVRAGDLHMAYRIYGEHNQGTPVVLIMGYGCTMDMWPAFLLDQLAANYKVIVFDNRGMGYTSSSGREFTIELFAEDTARLLEALKVEHIHILGWSMGSFIAQEMALKHPARVDKLILYGSFCGGIDAVWPTRQTWQRLTDTSGSIEVRLDRMFHNLFPENWLKEHRDPLHFFPPLTESSPDENIIRQARAMEKWPGTYDRLPSITQTTFIITGTEDIIIPPGNAFILGERIPGASVVQIKQAGHGLMYQCTEEFTRYIMTFLGD